MAGSSKIAGHNCIEIAGATQPNGKDTVSVEYPKSTVQARFNEIGTNKPMLIKRDNKKKIFGSRNKT